MSTAREALEATLEARYRAAVEENVRLTTTRNELANEVARLSSDLTDVRADLVNAGRVTEELTQERNGFIEAVRLHLEEHTETARERDEARSKLERVTDWGNRTNAAAVALEVERDELAKQVATLVKALPATSPGLRVVPKAPDSPDD